MAEYGAVTSEGVRAREAIREELLRLGRTPEEADALLGGVRFVETVEEAERLAAEVARRGRHG